MTKMVYVGQTIVDLDKRWGDHCSKGSNCRFLSRAINKYGKENFTIEQIDTALSIEELNQKEIYWIEQLNSLSPNGYNLKTGGSNGNLSQETKDKISNSNLGKKRTEKSKQLMREKQLGKKHTEEHRRKISEGNRGKSRPSKYKGIPRKKEDIEKSVQTRKLNNSYSHSEETKKKQSNSHKGLKQSEEHKANISKKLKGIVRSPETREKMRQAQKLIALKKKQLLDKSQDLC
jgi:group I intron endonuclease